MSATSDSSEDGGDTWIQWFCAREGHEMFCEVERSYIEDGFNLYGLRHWVPSINDSLDIILDRESPDGVSEELMEATYTLYGLIHARYVITTPGLEAMYAKYTLHEFGYCPHFLCGNEPSVPLGVRDEPYMETVKLYCPKCQDIYVHPSSAAQGVDGAYFGTTFPHLFFMTYRGVMPNPPAQTFVPRVFGFRVHASAANGASARGQAQEREHRLRARRQLRRPPSSLAAAVGEDGAAAAVSPTTANGRRGGSGLATGRGSGAGAGAGAFSVARDAPGLPAGGVKREERGEAGKVVVRIKAEEEEWGDGHGATRAGGGGASGSDGRRDAEVEQNGAASNSRVQAMEDRRPARDTSSAQEQPRGATATEGFISNGKEKKTNGQRVVSAGKKGDDTHATAADAAIQRADREKANGDSASETVGQMHGSSSRYAGGGGSRGGRGGGGMRGTKGTRGGSEHGSKSVTAAGARDPPDLRTRSSGSQGRGTKRLLDVAREAPASKVSQGAGARGSVGSKGAKEVSRSRAKVPRSRASTASARASASTLVPPASAVAVEGGGAGAVHRRSRGRSPA